MSDRPKTQGSDATADRAKPAAPAPVTEQAPRVPEIGGRKGPDPTRYGDWEKDGRCVDF